MPALERSDLLFVSRLFQIQAELGPQERAHVLLALCLPFNRKTIHPSENAAFPAHGHGPMGLKPRLPSQFPSWRRVTPNQWFSARGSSAPQGTSGYVWRHCGCQTGGHSWPLMRGAQRCSSTFYSAQDAPRQRRVGLKMSTALRVGNPALHLRERATSKFLGCLRHMRTRDFWISSPIPLHPHRPPPIY